MFIDLSVVINEQTPVYPGDPVPKIKHVNHLEEAGFVDHSITLGTHTGTHIDAPMHMLKTSISLADTPIDRFVGQGKVITVKGNDFSIVTEHNIEKDDIVLFYTAMSESYNDPRYFQDYPAMSEEIAEYLVAKEVKMVGIDTCSIDNQPHFPVHKKLLGNNILIIENLVNLRAITDKQCTIFALPLNVALDGAPARVIAQI